MTEAVNKPWKRCVSDLRITWIVVLLLSVLPGVLYGTGILSMLVLLGAVLLGLPTALLAQLLSCDIEWRARIWRRAAVLVVVPTLTIAVIFHTDKLAPEMADPIAKAIESFKQETGSYPGSLATLSPKYLPSVPAVRGCRFSAGSHLPREGRAPLSSCAFSCRGCFFGLRIQLRRQRLDSSLIPYGLRPTLKATGEQ